MKTALRHPSPNGLVKRSVRIFKDGMKKWAHGRLRVSYLFVRWIAPVTRTLQLFHATTLILNRIISTSLTNSFPARANTWMLQKSRDSSRHFRVSQLVKSCTSLTSSSIKQCGVSLWLSQVEIFLPNEQASETVDSLQQQNYFEFWEMQLAAQHDWIAQDYNERKIPVNVFFFQRPTYSSRDMSNCTKSVYSISFAVHEITLNHSGVLSFSFSRHVQYSWW